MKYKLSALALIVAGMISVYSCGKQDQDNSNCIAYGDDCDEDQRTKNEEGPTIKQGPQGASGKDGESCTVEAAVDGTLIKCSGSETLIKNGTNGADGSDGIDGTDGLNGADGYSIVVDSVAVAPSCTSGGKTLLVGRDLNRNNLLDLGIDDQVQSLEVCNGIDGVDGVDGQDGAPSAFTPVGMINPCGDAPGIYDELFFKLSNGMLIASFSDTPNGKNTRFSELVAGSYITTDGDECSFTVDSYGNIVTESKHY